MKFFIWLSVALACVGCGTTTEGSRAAGKSPIAETQPSPPADLAAKLPDSLRNDAYTYYGLGNDQPIALELTQTSGKGPGTSSDGEVQVSLKDVKEGAATFDIVYGGDLQSTLGTNQMKLAKDGLHALSTASGKVIGDDLELPATLTNGTVWHTKNTVEAGGEKVVQDLVFKVVGRQNAVTKAKTYSDAWFVLGTGTMTRGGKSYKVEAKAWYVKDRGPVRQEMVIHTDPPSSVVIQERKAS